MKNRSLPILALLSLMGSALAEPGKWGADDLRQALTEHLVKTGRQAPIPSNIGPLDPRMSVAACEKLDITARGNAGTSFILRCDAPQAWQHVLRVDNLPPHATPVEPMVAPAAAVNGQFRIVVAKVDLSAGSILSENDLEERPVNVSPGATALKSVADAVGLRLASSVGPGLALTTRLVVRTPTILKGENVTLLANGSGFEISIPGRAEQDGFEGDVITVRNVRSGSALKGRIGKGKTVSVLEL